MKCVQVGYTIHMDTLPDVHSYSSDTSSLKLPLLQRRASLDLLILFAGLPGSSLSDGLDFHISGRVLGRWMCSHENLGVGVKHPLSWGFHMV